MHCSTCGARVPANRDICETCGSWIDIASRASVPVAGDASQHLKMADAVASCPRCQYAGEGVGYFSRGSHMLALIGLTLLTLPMIFGLGGILYYLARRDHHICPRCGLGWGKLADPSASSRPSHNEEEEGRYGSIGTKLRGAGVKRPWSIMLLTIGAILLAVGVVEFEALSTVLGVLAVAGGVTLHRQANQERDERRAALLAALQTPVLQLAADRGGRLTVTEVAAALRWPIRRAEKILHSLDDGWRVSSNVTDEGVIVYEFRELLLGQGPSSYPDPLLPEG